MIRPNPIHPWETDLEFTQVMSQIQPYTLVDPVRCFMLYQLAKQASSHYGDVAEIGVYRGGTAKLLSRVFKSTTRTIHLFDTFSGMPIPDPIRDLHKEKDFNDTSLKSVQTFMQDCQNVRFYEGLFPMTAEPVQQKFFCLVHIDVDIYRSVIDCCNFFYSRMVEGGIMIFDDYGFLSCPGAKLAVDEFFSNKPERVIYLPTGQCFISKESSQSDY